MLKTKMLFQDTWNIKKDTPIDEQINAFMKENNIFDIHDIKYVTIQTTIYAFITWYEYEDNDENEAFNVKSNKIIPDDFWRVNDDGQIMYDPDKKINISEELNPKTGEWGHNS